MIRRSIYAALLCALAGQAAAEGVVPKGVIRYRLGAATGFNSELGTSFIHGLDASLHLGKGDRNWVVALSWEIEWACHGPWSDSEFAKFTVCTGPAQVDAVATSIKTVTARPMASLKRVISAGTVVSVGGGLGFLRSNTPIISERRTYFVPSAALSLERYVSGIVFSVTAQFQGFANTPQIGWITVGIGIGRG